MISCESELFIRKQFLIIYLYLLFSLVCNCFKLSVSSLFEDKKLFGFYPLTERAVVHILRENCFSFRKLSGDVQGTDRKFLFIIDQERF